MIRTAPELDIFSQPESFALNALEPLQLDALREIGTIGGGAAATALSALTKKRILIEVPDLAILSRHDVESLFHAGRPAAVVSMDVIGDVNGTALLVVDGRTATVLAESILGMDVGEFPRDFNDLAQSTIIEVGNILAGAYLNTLSDFLGLMMIMSIPEFTIRTTQNLFRKPAPEGRPAQLLHIHTLFHVEDELTQLNGDLIIAPTVPSLRAMLAALRMA